jgi:hypothetical protein
LEQLFVIQVFSSLNTLIRIAIESQPCGTNTCTSTPCSGRTHDNEAGGGISSMV